MTAFVPTLHNMLKFSLELAHVAFAEHDMSIVTLFYYLGCRICNLRSVLQSLVTANVVPRLPNLVTLMMEAIVPPKR
jgi:hypothetical protein